jgi:hypothetical protein
VTAPPAAPARAGPAQAVSNFAQRSLGALGAVVVPYVVARVIVLGALAFAHLVVSRTHPSSPGVAARVHQGLLAWDAGFYESIARFGYRPFGHQALRFFPLFPLAARALAWLPGVSDRVAVVVIANLGTLIGTALLVVLVRRETGDDPLARRSAWLLSLAPPAFVLVLGYAEGLLLVFTVACFLALRPAAGRRPSWLWAELFGYAAALTRPLGVLLVLPVACEAWRHWRGAPRAERAAIALALAGPVAGLVTFLAWSAAAFGDFFLPIRVQTNAGHHGGLSDPFRTLVNDAKGALHHHFGTALHVPWVVLVVVLVVVVWMRLPSPYGAFATGVVLVALSGTNLDSFERYALSAFPLVIVGAMGLASRRVERVVLTLSAAGLLAYALLAFLNLSVP